MFNLLLSILLLASTALPLPVFGASTAFSGCCAFRPEVATLLNNGYDVQKERNILYDALNHTERHYDAHSMLLLADEWSAAASRSAFFGLTELLAANGGVKYGALDSLGRPSGVSGVITEGMLGTGTRANQSIIPPGFQGGAAGQARGHLLGAQLGGSGNEVRNLVTILQNPANAPVMRGFENAAAAAVRGGQTLNYSAVPIYQGVNAVPRGITIISSGSGGFQQSVTILNPIP